MPDKWALLIGVDFYFPGNERPVHFNHLRGCVNDVSRIEEYLRSINVHNIERLTASYNGSDEKPAESDEEIWPTFDNIKAKFDAIRRSVKPGDLVYIHYSGHGILRHKLNDLGENDGDAVTGTALALTDVMTGGAYLTGYQLGVWVRSLVEIDKVRVSITLDSCYSGRGFRDGEGDVYYRTAQNGEEDELIIESDRRADKFAEEYESKLPKIDADADKSDLEHRNATVRWCWLSNPEGCTVLTACQLDQRAGEYWFEGEKGRNGILTHWMLDTVRQPSGLGTPTYARIRQHVKSSIKAVMGLNRPQVPVLHGDGCYEFFGSRQLVQHPACLVQVSDRPGSLIRQLTVDVGAAQGAAAGAIYSVYPSSWRSQRSVGVTASNWHRENTPVSPPKIRIDETRMFRSSGTLIDADNVPEYFTPATGSLAVLDTWALPSWQHIKVPPLPDNDADHALRSVIVGLMEYTIATNTIDGTADHPCNLIVSLDNDSRKLVIKDGKGVRIPRVPGISVDDEGAAAKITYLLKNLARFIALKTFAYVKPSTSMVISDYRFELLDDDEKKLEKSNEAYELRDNQAVIVRFMNQSNAKNVHVAIFMFNATWGVDKIYPTEGQPTAQVVPGDEGAVLCGVAMCVTKRAHPEDPPDIRDLFRAYIYVGDHPPSWDELQLPDIPANAACVPTGLPVEPMLDEDVGEDEITRNRRKGYVRRRSKDSDKADQWTMLEFWAHTK
ncbi:hypothetical protein F5Y01DRAFT_267996 [Xylaria sp. FL0043]|nr:hypothetical protein F5Y01DRAFT_267996 [Xylaria sp. FL0043]